MYLITLIDIIMIDSIKLWISAEELKSIDLMAELPLKLNGISTTIDDKTNRTIIRGYLNSLCVIVTVNGVTISGSLSKYYYGNNMYTLSFSEIKSAFKMIENQLGITIEKGRVQRLDISENFIVDNPVHNYYPYLGELTYYERQEVNNGIYYNGSKQTILFYDKVHERKVKREKVLDCYIDKNVFRYELRFEHRLGKLFDRKALYVSDLIDALFFSELVKRYMDQFQKIYKHKSLVHYSELQINDRSQFWRQIKLRGIKELGGESVLLQLVKQARKDKSFKNSMHATRIIQEIKRLYMNNPFTEANSLVKELEQKIPEKLNAYLIDNDLPLTTGIPEVCLFN